VIFVFSSFFYSTPKSLVEQTQMRIEEYIFNKRGIDKKKIEKLIENQPKIDTTEFTIYH